MELIPGSQKKTTPRQAVSVPRVVIEHPQGLWDKSAAAGIPAMPLLGVLPLRRLMPQDIHSLLDYQGALSVLGAGLLSSCLKARTAGVVLGAAGLGVSLLTDYRLSLRKFIPIEVHEVIDHTWSLGVIAAPFLMGFTRSARWATRVNLLVGLTTILGSLFTDYRAQQGVQWGRGRVTDLGPVGA